MLCVSRMCFLIAPDFMCMVILLLRVVDIIPMYSTVWRSLYNLLYWGHENSLSTLVWWRLSSFLAELFYNEFSCSYYILYYRLSYSPSLMHLTFRCIMSGNTLSSVLRDCVTWLELYILWMHASFVRFLYVGWGIVVEMLWLICRNLSC